MIQASSIIKLALYRLDKQYSIPRRHMNFSLCHCIQASSGAYQTPNQCGQTMKLSIHLHVILRLRMHGAVPPFSYIAPWHGA